MIIQSGDKDQCFGIPWSRSLCRSMWTHNSFLCLFLYVLTSPLLWFPLNLAFPSFATRLPSAASFNDLIRQMQFIFWMHASICAWSNHLDATFFFHVGLWKMKFLISSTVHGHVSKINYHQFVWQINKEDPEPPD